MCLILGFHTDKVVGIDLGQQDICIDHMGTMLPLRAYRPRFCVAKETMLVTDLDRKSWDNF